MQTEIVEILDKANVKGISIISKEERQSINRNSLKGKWTIGKIIESFFESKDRIDIYGKEINKIFSERLGISNRHAYRCRQFFKTFRSTNWKEALQLIPMGFNWHNFLNGNSYDPAIEESLKKCIIKELREKDWNIETEKQTPVGRIDIFASTRVSSRIIEVKGNSSLRSVREAFGQLFFYQEYYPRASIFIVVPRLPSKAVRKVLDRWRVGIIWPATMRYKSR